MHYLFIPFFAALQVCFLYLLFRFLGESKRNLAEIICIHLIAWFAISLFSYFDFPGIYGYSVYLLMAVVLLLFLYGENGMRGPLMIAMALGVPLIIDSAFLHFAANSEGVVYYLAALAGKALPIALVLILRKTGVIGSIHRADSDMLLLKQHMELQKESMNALEQNYRLQRKSTHEFEHHLQVLGDLLGQGETKAASDYLEKLKKNRSIHVMGVNSRHPIVDVILNQKYQLARENEVNVNVQVNDLSEIDIPSDSLVVVLTNLWDNAIEACRRIDGYREIFCSVLYDDGLYISIRNTSNPVTITDGKIATSKQDPLSHGFGLASVCYTLDKFDADYSYGYEDGWFNFVAEIEK